MVGIGSRGTGGPCPLRFTTLLPPHRSGVYRPTSRAVGGGGLSCGGPRIPSPCTHLCPRATPAPTAHCSVASLGGHPGAVFSGPCAAPWAVGAWGFSTPPPSFPWVPPAVHFSIAPSGVHVVAVFSGPRGALWGVGAPGARGVRGWWRPLTPHPFPWAPPAVHCFVAPPGRHRQRCSAASQPRCRR